MYYSLQNAAIISHYFAYRTTYFIRLETEFVFNIKKLLNNSKTFKTHSSTNSETVVGRIESRLFYLPSPSNKSSPKCAISNIKLGDLHALNCESLFVSAFDFVARSRPFPTTAFLRLSTSSEWYLTTRFSHHSVLFWSHLQFTDFWCIRDLVNLTRNAKCSRFR